MIKIIKELNIFKKGLAPYRKHKLSGAGFVILFAVTIAAILLSIALGITSVTLKEVEFGTSAVDTNNAFFAADTGIESVLYTDTTTPYAIPSSTTVTIVGLGSTGLNCAIVSITKDSSATPSTTVISKGYNVGGDNSSCTSSSSNRVEREVDVSY